jgi:hypothetical protein
VFAKNLLAVRLTFNKRYRFKSANYALSGVGEAANAAEGVQEAKGGHISKGGINP